MFFLFNSNLVYFLNLNFNSNTCYLYINYLLRKYFSLATLAVFKDKYAAYEA